MTALSMEVEEIVGAEHEEHCSGESRDGDHSAGYRLLFEANPQPMWVYDVATLRFLAVNDAALRRYGYSRDEFRALTIADIRPEEDRPALARHVGERPPGSNGISTSGVWRHRTKSGAVMAVEIVSEPVDFAGRRARLVMARDVTEQRRAEERFRAVFDQGAVPAAVASPDGRLLVTNTALQELLGYSEEDLRDRSWAEIVHPDDLEEVAAAMAPILAGESRRAGYLKRHLRADGATVWADVAVTLVHDVAGNPEFFVGQVRDVTEHRRTEEALAAQARLAVFGAEVTAVLAGGGPLGEILQGCCQAMVDHLDAAFARVWTLGDDGATLELRASAGCYTHLDGGHARVPIGQFKIGWIAEQRRPHLTNAVVGDPRVDDQEWARREGMVAFAGYPLLAKERLVGVVAMFARHALPDSVLTAMAVVANELAGAIERNRAETALVHQALHDRLTGLPNRLLLLDRLERTLAWSRRTRGRFAVLLLDVDHFRLVNESLGHGSGDQLLVAVAERLGEVNRATDTVARFGGDEFVIVCDDVAGEEDVAVIRERIAGVLERPLVLDGHEHVVTASIGIVLAGGGGGATPGSLLRDAETALHRAKELGGGQSVLYEEALTARATARLELVSALRHVLERAELSLVYQPIVDLAGGTAVGAEALVRWHHPQRGPISPAQFIPLAEETRMIVPIGTWVLQEACRRHRRLQEVADGWAPLTLSVNVSVHQLTQPGFLDLVAEVLSANDLDPARLQLEITESVLMGDADYHVETLLALKTLGVRVSIDDFGTGYSNLAYLSRFAVDEVKVDRAFVSGPGAEKQGWPIAAAVVGLARAFHLVVLAEGIETTTQLAGMRALGCRLGQGYLFSRPLPAGDFAELVASEPRW